MYRNFPTINFWTSRDSKATCMGCFIFQQYKWTQPLSAAIQEKETVMVVTFHRNFQKKYTYTFYKSWTSNSKINRAGLIKYTSWFCWNQQSFTYMHLLEKMNMGSIYQKFCNLLSFVEPSFDLLEKQYFVVLASFYLNCVN